MLAAGQGKRMKSCLPKVLHPVLGKPILRRVLDALDGLGLEHIHLVVGHMAAEVESYLAGSPPLTPFTCHRQEPQLGTGHALMQVAPALSSFAGTVVVTPADTPLITGATLAGLLESHRRKMATASLITTFVADAKSYGRIVRAENGRIVRIVEDRDASLEEKDIREINPAFYCFQWPEVESGLSSLSNDNKQGEYYLTDLIGWAVGSGQTIADSLAPDWREVAGVNSRLELSEACRLMSQRTIERLSEEAGVTVIDPLNTWIAPEVTAGRDTTIFPGCYLTGDIEIGAGAKIGPHTVIEGPASVGDGSTVVQSLIVASAIGDSCRVGPFAHLREGVVLADSVRVGNFVEVKKSEIGPCTNVSHLSYVGDATLGQGVNIGAGTITANYDHISKVKSRTVIADGASTGSNSVLVAPVTIGPEAVVAASTAVTRDVPAGALAVGRARMEIREGWAESRKRKLGGQ